jgi:High potential iron-sulfur protein
MKIVRSTEEALMHETCKNSGVSRRTVLIAVAGAAPLLALTGGEAQAKLAQAAVKYQPDPKDGHQCDGCVQFVAPNSCKLVDGEIAATGWCSLWVKKPSS